MSSLPAISPIVQGCVEALSFAELAQRTLPLFARQLNLSVASAFEESDDGHMVGHTPAEMPDLIGEYAAHYVLVDPLRRAKLATSAPLIVPSRLIDRSALRHTAVYNDFFHRWRMEHLLILRLHQDDGHTLGFALWRASRHGDFSENDLRPIHRLMALLQATGKRVARTKDLTRQLTQLESLVESDDSRPRLLVDGRGKVVWASAQMLQHFSELADLLSDPSHALSRSIQHVATDPLDLSPQEAILRLRLGDGRGIEVVVSRPSPSEPIALVTVHGDDRFEQWARQHRLSRSEAGVLLELCRGLNNQEIGARLFVSRETVRTHLTRIFKKLEVQSRLQAALLVRSELGPALTAHADNH